MPLPAIAPYPMPTPAALPENRVDWTVDPGRAVLLVHDLQNYFLRAFPQDAVPLTELLGNVGRLTKLCRAVGLPVVYTAQPGGQTPEQRGLQQDFWGDGVPDDRDAEGIAASVAPQHGDTLLTKWKYSAFARTDLAEQMYALGRDQLIVVGVYAHIGVQMTACDAWMRDIRPFVVADAVADFSEADHLQALHWAARTCALVTTTDALAQGIDEALGLPGNENAAGVAP
ncbi:isochorismatase family protein [Streptomyces halobius]|uniref:Isochorismatase family protein n=1 Tax=Streptomyces halobius TaxID=2879846 RepID=A0ABY4MGM4_9ACTN|nr:isochorismatase family protein [Streptomyces halobius]UQA96951.1 isochorismatase family protein [Streptomyces halobius]